MAFFDPMRRVFADYAQDQHAQKVITEQYISYFQYPLYQQMFTLDEHLNLLTVGDDGFIDARRAAQQAEQQQPGIMAKRAEAFLEKQCDQLANICYDIFDAFHQKSPTGEQLRNIRLSIDTQNNAMQVRLANPLEQIADATLGRIRDARAGSLSVDHETIAAGDGGQPNPLDRLANWLVNQPLLRPLATQIAENYSSFMMPDEDQNHSTVLKEWRMRKKRTALERTFESNRTP